jgi:inorganic pyrophosphatase
VIKSIDHVDATLKDQIEHFFTYYKGLDEGKWVKIDGWGDAKEAKKPSSAKVSGTKP